jgi:hypothetical protein
MQNRTERMILANVLARVRRKLFFNAACQWWVRAGIVLLPVAAALVAADQRWNAGRASGLIALAALGGLMAASVLLGLRGLGERVRSALTLDEHAHLKDRVSSAWEFLDQPNLDEARRVQIRDAIRHVEALDYARVLRAKLPRFAIALPAAALLLALSFFVPSLAPARSDGGGSDPVKAAQLQQLDELKQELAAKQDLPEELQDVLKKLEEVRKQFERGAIGERDLMLQLGRLDESLRTKVAEIGVENLESEMNAMVPHLSANAATMDAAKAMKEKQLDKAAEELKNLGDKVADKKLSKEDEKKLAAQLGAAAAKLGKKKRSDSFGGDLAQASEALENSDNEGFKSACKGMCDKLGLLKKCNGLKSACNKIGLCKACLGQCDNKELGYKLGPKMLAKGKGGLKAGTSTSGDPLGDPNRLADSYKKLLQISGQAGQGPTETETEITDGLLSQSQLRAKELHANYAAAAEEVIEKEDIPLSHRYHVKRYFQAIRPQE